MQLKLHTLASCPFCLRVKYVLEALQVPYQEVLYTKVEQLKTDEYLKLNPKGEAPVLETPQGVLYESGTIMRYLASLRPELGLNGRNHFEASQVELWMVNTSILCGSIAGVTIQLTGRFPTDQQKFDQGLENMHKQLASFNEYLSPRTYVVGHQATLVEFSVLPFLNMAFQFILEEKERLSYPNVNRYWKNLTASTVHTHLMGEKRKLATKLFKLPAVVPAPAATTAAPAPAAAGKPAGGDKPKAGAAEKPKTAPTEKPKVAAAAPKPAEAPAPAAAKLTPEEEAANAAASAFLYAFKTTFTNALDKVAATEELLNTYDKNQFSFWFGRYDKHPSEGKELIPTNNLLTNFVARVADVGAAKHLLAVYGIYGEEPDLNLQGVWFWRGLNHLKELEQHPVNEFVKWEKLDPSNATHRAKILAFWSQTKSEEGTVEGTRVRTVKIVK